MKNKAGINTTGMDETGIVGKNTNSKINKQQRIEQKPNRKPKKANILIGSDSGKQYRENIESQVQVRQ